MGVNNAGIAGGKDGTQPWEFVVTRSRVPIVRGGIALVLAPLFLVVWVILFQTAMHSLHVRDAVTGAGLAVVVWFWARCFSTCVARISVIDDVMTIVAAISSVTYRLSDIRRIRFISVPASSWQGMYLRTQSDLIGHFYHYTCFGADLTTVERELLRRVQAARGPEDEPELGSSRPVPPRPPITDAKE